MKILGRTTYVKKVMRLRLSYHRITAEAQVKPDPKAVSTTQSPLFNRPSRTASSRAMGMDAAVVFPNRSMFRAVFSMGIWSRRATI